MESEKAMAQFFKDGIRSYVGEWANDKKHGTGTATHFNGRVYTGSWRHGKMYGHGVLVHPCSVRRTLQ
jgi:hypothetical protein